MFRFPTFSKLDRRTFVSAVGLQWEPRAGRSVCKPGQAGHSLRTPTGWPTNSPPALDR